MLQPARVDASCAGPGTETLELQLVSVTRGGSELSDLSDYDDAAVTVTANGPNDPGVSVYIQGTDQALTAESRTSFSETYHASR